MIPAPTPPPFFYEIVRLVKIVRQAFQQLGHLFWMSLLSVGLVWIWWPWQMAATVMGFEFASFSIHQMDKHPEEGWLAMPGVTFLGLAVVCVMAYQLGWAYLAPQTVTVIGSQIVSTAIHRLQSGHRQGKSEDNASYIIIGLAICALPMAVDLSFH